MLAGVLINASTKEPPHLQGSMRRAGPAHRLWSRRHRSGTRSGDVVRTCGVEARV